MVVPEGYNHTTMDQLKSMEDEQSNEKITIFFKIITTKRRKKQLKMVLLGILDFTHNHCTLESASLYYICMTREKIPRSQFELSRMLLNLVSAIRDVA